MKRRRLLSLDVILVALILFTSAIAAQAQSLDSTLTAANLDKLSEKAWQPSLLTAFGTFT